MSQKMPAEVIAALSPVLELEVRDHDEDKSALGSMPRRRRGALEALIKQASLVESLPLEASALFVAAAAQSAVLVLAGNLAESNSAAAQALSKAYFDLDYASAFPPPGNTGAPVNDSCKSRARRSAADGRSGV